MMRPLFKGRKPTDRGAYLFVWGTVYIAVGFITQHEGTHVNDSLFAGLFIFIGMLAIAASFFHVLSTIAFSALSGSAVLRSLSFLFAGSIPGISRLSAFVLWVGVGLAQLVVARWPVDKPRNSKYLYHDTGEFYKIKRLLKGGKESE